MFKAPFLFILCLFISTAFARPDVIRHEQFRQLTQKQQDEFVVKVMELVVELESKYEHETKVSGFSLERYERYVEVMKKVSSFFVNSAYAAADPAWASNAQNVLRLINNGSANRCIYAGWPSQVRMQTVSDGNGGSVRKNICIHPNFIGGAVRPQESRAYLDAGDCRGSRDKITCNPAIFGYKNKAQKSVFCVPAGVKDSENSSLACMREALNESPANGVDSAAVRLDYLKENLTGPEGARVYDELHNFLYKTCICEGNTNKIHRDYLTYMRPHRTCYGLMQMIASTAIECKPANEAINTSIFEQLNQFTNDNTLKSRSSDPESVDGLYQTYLTGARGTPTYAELCGGGPAIVTREDTPDDGGGQASGGSQGGTPNGEDTPAKKEYECKATCEAKTEEPVVASTTSRSGDRGSRGPGSRRPPPPGAPAEGEESQDEETPTPAASAFTCTPKFFEKGTTTEATPSVKSILSTPTSKENASMSVKATFAGEEKEYACAVEFPDAGEDQTTPPGISIKVSLGSKSATAQDVNAKVEGEKGSYKIVWYREGFPGGDAKPTTPPKETTPPIAGISDEPQEEEKPAEVTKGEIPEASDKDKISEPLKDKTYQTCAKLVAEGKPAIGGNCVTIPKLGGQGGFVPGATGQPMQMPRGSSSTSAGGIR